MKPASVKKIMVYMVDNQKLFKEVSAPGLSRYQEIEVTGGCDFSEDVRLLVDIFSPQVVILSIDNDFGRDSGLGYNITTSCPVAEFVALTSDVNHPELFQSIKSRMDSWDGKEMSVDELGDIIRRVVKGWLFWGDNVFTRAPTNQGDPEEIMTHDYIISKQNSQNRSTPIFSEPGVEDCTNVYALAIRLGWLSLKGPAGEQANN